MNPLSTPEENQFDDLLRRSLTGMRAAPDGHVWPAVQAAIRPQPPTRWQRLRPLGAGLFLGALLTGLVPHDQPAPQVVAGSVASSPESTASEVPAYGSVVRLESSVREVEASARAGFDSAQPDSVRLLLHGYFGREGPTWRRFVRWYSGTFKK